MNPSAPTKSVSALLANICVFLLPAAPGYCQNAAWINALGGFYEETSNWVPGVVPGATNDVLINVPGSYNIALQGDHSANSFLIPNNNDLTLSSGGPGDAQYTYSLAEGITITNSSLTLGDLTQGRLLQLDNGGALNMSRSELTLLNGAQLSSLPSLSNSNLIDGSGGVASQIEVRGTDASGQASRWQSGGGIQIGSTGGSASLSILDGGQVSSMGTVGIGTAIAADGSSLEVRGTSTDGMPSSLTSNSLNLGFLGSGGGVSIANATVSDGGSVSTGNVQVNNDSRVLIEGEDVNLMPSTWEAGAFGVSGGFVDILSGGALSSDFVILNRLAIAKVNGVGADGRSSRWDIADSLTLGSNNGFGSLLIDGGQVTSATAEIGRGAGNSLLSVEGTPDAEGVWENSGDVFVGGSNTGPDASGDLRLLNDAHVEIGGTLTVWGPGSVLINGGLLQVDMVDHTNGGDFEFNAGQLSANRFDGDLENVAGEFTPGGYDAASTTIFGDYIQHSGATLSLSIGGTGPGSTHDLVSVSGDVQLDGQLALNLTDGFTPDASDELTVFASGTLLGFFDNVNTGQRLDTSDGRGSFVVNYGIGSPFDETRIVLTDFEANPFPPGDFDLDGDVDSRDFLVWQQNQSVGDLSAWQTNFGSGTNPLSTSSAAQSIPEPCSFILFALAVKLSNCLREHRLQR